jgi:hypothetical protein
MSLVSLSPICQLVQHGEASPLQFRVKFLRSIVDLDCAGLGVPLPARGLLLLLFEPQKQPRLV